MTYEIEFKANADKDLEKLPPSDVKQILSKIVLLQNNLQGNVKKLTDYFPRYRLRVGMYRVLFNIEGNKIVIYRIVNRKDAY